MDQFRWKVRPDNTTSQAVADLHCSCLISVSFYQLDERCGHHYSYRVGQLTWLFALNGLKEVEVFLIYAGL